MQLLVLLLGVFRRSSEEAATCCGALGKGRTKKNASCGEPVPGEAGTSLPELFLPFSFFFFSPGAVLA